MKKNTIFVHKAVISSIFVVAIMCLASTAVPSTSGSNINKILENKKNSIITNCDIEIKGLIELMRDGGKITFDDIFKIFKKQIQNYNSPILNNLFKKLKTNYENYYNKYEFFYTTSKDNICNNEISTYQNFSSLDFERYWENYSQFRDKIEPHTSFYEWGGWVEESIEKLITRTIGYFILACIIALIVPILAFVVISYALALFAIDMLYYTTVVDLYNNVQYHSIGIILNVTNPYGEGIDNLEITLTNIDVPNGDYKNDFYYLMQESRSIQKSGFYEITAYHWLHLDLPPCPPGFWDIVEIDDLLEKGYEGYEYEFDEIPSSGILDEHILIYKNHPYIFEKYPWDGAEDIELNPMLYVDVKDYQSDQMNINFYIKETYGDNYTQIIEYLDVPSGQYTAQTESVFKENTTYYWMVSVEDQQGNEHTQEFSFKTYEGE